MTEPSILHCFFSVFLIVSQAGELSLEEVRQYELSTFPLVLFEPKNEFRKADQPLLAQAIRDYASAAGIDFVPEAECFVLDGVHSFTEPMEVRRKLRGHSAEVHRLHCQTL